MQKISNHTLHIFRPQHYETQNQPQEIIWEDHNTWRLKNILLKNEWANKAVKEEFKKYMKVNENDTTTTQNPWDTAKAVIRGKYIVIQASLKREERSLIHNLTLTLKGWKKKASKVPNQEKKGIRETRPKSMLSK